MARLRVREVAEEKGLDIAKLSRRADLAYKTVWQLWTDPNKDVSIKTLDKLAAALNVPFIDLIDANAQAIPPEQAMTEHRRTSSFHPPTHPTPSDGISPFVTFLHTAEPIRPEALTVMEQVINEELEVIDHDD